MANVIAIFLLGALVSWIAFGVIAQLTSLTRIRQELEQRIALLSLEKDNLSRRCAALSREHDAQALRHAELTRFVNRLAAEGLGSDDAFREVGRLSDKERELLDLAGKRMQELVESVHRKAYEALYEADRVLRAEAREVLRRHVNVGASEAPEPPEAGLLRKEA